MNPPATTATWHEANQRYLTAALGRVRAALERHATRTEASHEARAASASPDGAPWHGPDLDGGGEMAPPALEQLCATFGLSAFERDVLLLCAGVELEASFAALCADAQGEAQRPFPTFGLALAALPEAHWSALTPSAPLRRWRLLDVGAGSSLTASPLRIDERVLHFLAGVQHLDEHLAGFVRPAAVPEGGLVPSHRAVAERIAATWSQEASRGRLSAIQLCGNEAAGKRAVAAAACALVGLQLFVMPADALPTSPADLDTLVRLWEREAALGSGALLLDCEDLPPGDAARERLVSQFIEAVGSPLLVAARERWPLRHRPLVVLDLDKPTRPEQSAFWEGTLGGQAPTLNGQIDRLTAQFDLSTPTIEAACARARGQIPPGGEAAPAEMEAFLWEACRVQARQHLEGLAHCIEPVAAWDDLVLPTLQRQTLRDIVAQVRQRVRVYETWGFAARSKRGLGISALFAGPSGTGKTMAAEVLAHELRLDLYHIDLSQVVSKYIGETEKNLRRVFDAAEEGGAVLLFDEADALFGKRSEVKDSHDRYANIEVSYLLQRMETYRGLAILTTNMKNALDDAFQRRIRFMVTFPFPDAAQRAEIWRRIFPPETPTEGLDVEQLACLNVTGGIIRNIALHAAFLAADAGEPVRMAHLLRAARSVYARLEKPLTDNEIRGWL